jgi:hypothetical protein
VAKNQNSYCAVYVTTAIGTLGQGQAQAQGQSEIAGVNVFVASSATAKTHQLDLKGIEGESPT